MHLNLNLERNRVHNQECNPELSRVYRAWCRDNDNQWA